jgi:mRNA-degrading endonuclease RelE of RelBE toxin-antitoxin system
MLNVEYRDDFLKIVSKIKNAALKDKVKKQVEKILNNPEIGKPMRYGRKGSRELYVSPYRLAYAYIKEENKVIFLELYHKDEQ